MKIDKPILRTLLVDKFGSINEEKVEDYYKILTKFATGMGLNDRSPYTLLNDYIFYYKKNNELS